MINTLVVNNETYNVGLYLRLSKEDIKNGKDLESESIMNQKDILMQFVKMNNLNVYDIYIDDGYSGTNFDRPNFIRMIKDIESNKINMVITKDLSRLGRDYIGVGEYLERYFPSHNIRYIAINDNIDTHTPQSNLDMAPFKAVFNDMYAKDISKKITTSLKAKQKEGKWVGGCEPLGYMKDPNDKNHLIINEEEAWIVRKIFSLALEGKGISNIKLILENEKIPTCSQIRNSRVHGQNAIKGLWCLKTIKGIITNELYIGNMVQSKHKKLNYKIKKIVKNKKQDWIVVENTHQQIISKEDFELANRIIKKNYQRVNKDNIRLLDGLLICYECGHRISINKPRKSDGRTYISCNYYHMNPKLGVCTSHGFNYDYLEEAVLMKIKELCFNRLSKNKLKEIHNRIYSNIYKNIEYEKEKNENIITNLKEKLDKVYLDKLDNKIDDEMYDRISKKIIKEIGDSNKLLMNNKKNDFKFDYSCECEKILNDFISMKSINRSIILKLIDHIEIHNNKEVDIYYNFS